MNERRELTYLQILEIIRGHSLADALVMRYANCQLYGWQHMPTAAYMVNGSVFATWNWLPHNAETLYVECFPNV